MARLPHSGQDEGFWGDLLNSYLLTEHNPDGTHNVLAILGTPSQNNQVLLSSPSNPSGLQWRSLTTNDIGLSNVTNDAQLKAADLDTDATLAANSNARVPSQRAVKTYIDTHLDPLPKINSAGDTMTGTLRININETSTTPTKGLHINAANSGSGGAYAALFETGNVGIGTTTPTVSLDVNGGTRLSRSTGDVLQLVGTGTGNTIARWYDDGGERGAIYSFNAVSDFNVRSQADLVLTGNNGGTAQTMRLGSTGLTMGNGLNIIAGTTTGTKFGTASSQKLGFFGATPIIQPTGGVATASASYGANEQAMLQKIYNAMRTLGLIS